MKRRMVGRALLAFYDFPVKHWRNLRLTNPAKS